MSARTTLHAWLLLSPALVLLVGFTHYPAIATFWHSLFTTPRANRPARFIGAENYLALADDPVFWQALWNNLIYAGATIPLSIGLALTMALWVNGKMRGRTALRIAFFTPTVLPMIAVANLWLFFYTPDYGLLDQLTRALFGWGPTNWIGQRETALGAMIVVEVWKEAGFFMIFYLAALQAIPPNLYEAAAIEGASRARVFFRVTLPLLGPTTLFIAVNAVINGFRLVDHIIVMTRGGPDNATALLLTYIYEVGFRFWDTATASALTVVLLVILALTAALQFAFAEKRVHYRVSPTRLLETAAAWLLALVWVAPLLYAMWAAFHPTGYATRFELLAPLTLDNFAAAWDAAPFARYFLNTFALVTMVLAAQFVLCTLAAFAFARGSFPGSFILFGLVLVQLMILPDILLVENYRTMRTLGLVDTILAIGLPYMASAFGIFLLRQTFKQVPRELEEAARVEGCGTLGILLRVYVPLAKPIYLAYGLTSVSYHWNNFLWPLVITNRVEARPLTVGLSVFASSDQGIDWAIISAATLMTSAPLLLGFLLFQRQFVQSFMRAGIR